MQTSRSVFTVIVTASHTWSNAFCKDLSPASFHTIFVIVLRTICGKIFRRTIETNSTPIYIIYRKFHLTELQKRRIVSINFGLHTDYNLFLSVRNIVFFAQGDVINGDRFKNFIDEKQYYLNRNNFIIVIPTDSNWYRTWIFMQIVNDLTVLWSFKN